MLSCSVLIHVHLEILILIMGPSLRQKKEHLCHPATVGLFQQLPKYSCYRDNVYKEQKSKEMSLECFRRQTAQRLLSPRLTLSSVTHRGRKSAKSVTL